VAQSENKGIHFHITNSRQQMGLIHGEKGKPFLPDRHRRKMLYVGDSPSGDMMEKTKA